MMTFAIVASIFLAALANATIVDPNACYTPVLTSDLLVSTLSYPGLEGNLFPYPLCARDSLTVNLDCSGNGADVSSISFLGSSIANVTFTYYSGDAEVDSAEFVGGPLGQGFSFSDKQAIGVTSIKVTMDPISVFGVESPCVLVQGVDIRACCEGETGCAPGLSGIACQAFADYQNSVAQFNQVFPGVAQAGQQTLQVVDQYLAAAVQINQVVTQQLQNAALQAIQSLQALASQLGLDTFAQTIIQNVQVAAQQALQAVQALASQLGFGLDNPAVQQALQVVQGIVAQLGQYNPYFAQALQYVQGLAAQLV